MESDTTDSSVLVVGSANMDLVVSSDRFARPGETIMASDFGMYPGGKGANQAVACAKLGGRVQLMAKMGTDVFRDRLTRSLKQNRVDLRHVLTDEEASTGIALIAIDGDGQNQIIVVPGSNMALTPDEIEQHRDAFTQADVVLLQLEIPIETVERAAALASAEGATVILNPAPAQELSPSLLQNLDWLTPNQSEAEHLTDQIVNDLASAQRAGRQLLQRGVGRVLVTMGAQGAVLIDPDRHETFPGKHVEAVDTTAAGDAFNGALAYALAAGEPVDAAIELANRVAALSVTLRGAQTSMPVQQDLQAFSLDGESNVARPFDK